MEFLQCLINLLILGVLTFLFAGLAEKLEKGGRITIFDLKLLGSIAVYLFLAFVQIFHHYH